MSCVFCDVAAGKVDATVVWRDEGSMAFLDHRPLFPGHVLLIPTEHFETLPDLPPVQVGSFFQTAQKLATAVQVAMGSEGTFVAMNNVVSQSVPHLHVHIVPRRRGDGLKGFFWPRHPYGSDEERLEIGRKIAAEMARQTAY